MGKLRGQSAIDTDDVFREGEKHVDVELAVVVEQGKGEVEIEGMQEC